MLAVGWAAVPQEKSRLKLFLALLMADDGMSRKCDDGLKKGEE